METKRIKIVRRAFLKAIDQVETGGRDDALGAAGERGRYQLSRSVWELHSKKPFAYAHNRMFAHAVAERHFDRLVHQLELANWPADAESIAAAWNAGLSATVNNHLTAATRDYAQRVANLYAENLKQEPAP